MSDEADIVRLQTKVEQHDGELGQHRRALKAVETGIAGIETTLETVVSTIDNINKTLVQGNGNDSLLTRMRLVETKFDGLKASVDDLQDQVSNQPDTTSEVAIADKKGVWQLRTALTTGILGFLTAMALAVAQFFATDG